MRARGWSLRAISEEDLTELFYVREALEGMAARLAAENATPGEIAAIRELLEDMEAVLRRGDVGALRRLTGEFHQLVCRAAHNNRLLQSLQSLLDHVRGFQTSTLYSKGRPPEALEEHRALLAAIEARDGDGAERLAPRGGASPPHARIAQGHAAGAVAQEPRRRRAGGRIMAGETAACEFAALLRYEDIPASVIAMTKACVIDAVAVALFGSSLPWSNSVEQFARHVGSNGSSTILAPQLRRASAPAAALANGTFAHAFEFDNLRQPSVGVHPGSPPLGALAVAEEYGASGCDLLTALVAGNECMLRTGLAAKQTSELMGFHAPGQTGVFGSAIAASRIMRHDAHQTTMAIGIGGSLCSGLLAFAKAGNGGMVKRLHMGRAAEGGWTAAYLAARGFEGPDVLLEGKFGYLDVYARDGDPRLLTDGLGSRWESLNIWFKMFPCHVTAQAPVRAISAAAARARLRSAGYQQDCHRNLGESAVASRGSRAPGCWHGAIQRSVQRRAGAVPRPGRSPRIPRWP